MIEVYDKPTVAPFVVEKLGNNTNLDLGGSAVVLSRLETAHAKRVDLLFSQTQAGGIGTISIRAYTAGRLWYHEYQIHGGVAALTHSIKVAEVYSNATNEYVLGDTIDVFVTNTVNNNTIRCWAIARP